MPQSEIVQAYVEYDPQGTLLVTSCTPNFPASPQDDKQLEPNPLADWPHEEWDLVEGVVVSMKPYGVFVKVDDVVGLLHISGVSQKRVPSLKAVFKVCGQQLLVWTSSLWYLTRCGSPLKA